MLYFVHAFGIQTYSAFPILSHLLPLTFCLSSHREFSEKAVILGIFHIAIHEYDFRESKSASSKCVEIGLAPKQTPKDQKIPTQNQNFIFDRKCFSNAMRKCKMRNLKVFALWRKIFEIQYPLVSLRVSQLIKNVYFLASVPVGSCQSVD